MYVNSDRTCHNFFIQVDPPKIIVFFYDDIINNYPYKQELQYFESFSVYKKYERHENSFEYKVLR